jgi:hypothetical protein
MRIGLLTFFFLGSLPLRSQETPPVKLAPSPVAPVAEAAPAGAVGAVVIGEGEYRFSVDTTQAPDLAPWVKEKLTPVLKEWYPKIVEMLPGKDFEAPRTFSVVFDPKYTGVAATMGTLVVCNPEWYRKELDREGLGSVVHELVHVVQQYGRRRVPGWLTEGVADYIRWYLYEPESKGCEIPPEAADRVRHDQSYRVSANFLNWVATTHDKDLIRELNAALREGRYAPGFWEERTKKDLETLAAGWKTYLRDGQAESKDTKDGKDSKDSKD